MSVNRAVNKHRRNRSRKKGRTTAGAGALLGQALRALLAAGFFCLLGLCFIFVYDVLTQCDYFRAEVIEIQGADRRSRAEILGAAGITAGKNILSVNLSHSRKRLEADPWIRRASIGREFPSMLAIAVKEHEPLAVLDVGSLLLVDKEGLLFKEAAPGEMANLPIITGICYSEWEKTGESPSRSRRAVLDLLAALEGRKVFSGRFVREIMVDPDMGVSLRIEPPVMKIALGFGDYARKLRRIEQLLFRVDIEEGLPPLTALDAHNPKRIIATPRGPGCQESKQGGLR